MADQAAMVADFRKLDVLNDELHIIRRIMSKPEVVLRAPEVMDCIRMALDYTHSRYEALALEMRSRPPQSSHPSV